jgi:hypothetical protein
MYRLLVKTGYHCQIGNTDNKLTLGWVVHVARNPYKPCSHLDLCQCSATHRSVVTAARSVDLTACDDSWYRRKLESTRPFISMDAHGWLGDAEMQHQLTLAVPGTEER